MKLCTMYEKRSLMTLILLNQKFLDPCYIIVCLINSVVEETWDTIGKSNFFFLNHPSVGSFLPAICIIKFYPHVSPPFNSARVVWVSARWRNESQKHTSLFPIYICSILNLSTVNESDRECY